MIGNILKSDIIIIGAGLTGLAIAYLLRNKALSISIIESRDRVGGRIHTIRKPNSPPIELGATWLGKQHAALQQLLDELEIGVFEQVLGENAIYEPLSTSPPQIVKLPPNNDPSFRIIGGTDTLISTLVNSLKGAQIELNQTVSHITQLDNKLTVQTKNKVFEAPYVISTLPPHLLVNKIKVTPELPIELVDIANNTHTWMGESIKIALSYASPFWDTDGSSGTIFSNVGPIPEMYDHSDIEKAHYALKGFLDGSYYALSKSERLDTILAQLEKYYGTKVKDYLTYEEAVWKKEKFTSAAYTKHVLPHQNNGHQVYQQSYLDGQLLIAGAETSPVYGGYMEGAVRSAQQVCNNIL